MLIGYEKYHDDKTDIDYELPHFTMNGYNSQDDFYYENNLIIYSTIFNALEFAILNNLDVVPCFILDNFIFELSRPIFAEKLDQCLEYFKKIEYYEKCTILVKLKQLL